MENAIGEIVVLPNGKKARVVEESKYFCRGCIYDDRNCIGLRNNGELGHCDDFMRSDHKNIIYKETK